MMSRITTGLSQIGLSNWSPRHLVAGNFRLNSWHKIFQRNLSISRTHTGFICPPVTAWISSPAAIKLMCRMKSEWTSKHFDGDSDDHDDDVVVLEKGIDFTDRRLKVPSMRVDACIKFAFKLSRSVVEKEIYANKFRINGEKVNKRSRTLKIDDVIEYVKTSSSKVNPSLMEVSRVEVRHIGGFEDSGSHYYVVFRIYTNQLIPQWDS